MIRIVTAALAATLSTSLLAQPDRKLVERLLKETRNKDCANNLGRAIRNGDGCVDIAMSLEAMSPPGPAIRESVMLIKEQLRRD